MALLSKENYTCNLDKKVNSSYNSKLLDLFHIDLIAPTKPENLCGNQYVSNC